MHLITVYRILQNVKRFRRELPSRILGQFLRTRQQVDSICRSLSIGLRMAHSAARRRSLRQRVMRTVMCQAIILSLLIWPSPRITLGAIATPVSGFASTISGSVSELSSMIGSLRSAPIIVIPSAPIMIPFPVLPIWPFNVQASRPISMAERTARVATIAVAPHRMVGYMGETVTFVAMGRGIRGDLIHGAKFEWESSDTNKLTIDEAGRAYASARNGDRDYSRRSRSTDSACADQTESPPGADRSAMAYRPGESCVIHQHWRRWHRSACGVDG